MHFLLIIVSTEAADESMLRSVQNNSSKGYRRKLDSHTGETENPPSKARA